MDFDDHKIDFSPPIATRVNNERELITRKKYNDMLLVLNGILPLVNDLKRNTGSMLDEIQIFVNDNRFNDVSFKLYFIIEEYNNVKSSVDYIQHEIIDALDSDTTSIKYLKNLLSKTDEIFRNLSLLNLKREQINSEIGHMIRRLFQ
jgi:hypothetical protein